MLGEVRLDLDPALESPRALAPLIDPSIHSCGTVPPHGAEQLAQPEPGLFVVGMKSYGRAPTFLMLTGYEQVRSVVAALAGDLQSARRVELELPKTGVCSSSPETPRTGGCGVTAAPVDAGNSCCGTEPAVITTLSRPHRDEAPVPAANIKDSVKATYGAAALRVTRGGGSSCSGSTPSRGGGDVITSNLYGDETAGLPAEAVAASLGCGNPIALAELRPGDVVLDLGSGGGIDVLLSAVRVGPTGKAYGLDMTEEMLALARDNVRKAGVDNAEFLKGEIEHIPLPGDVVDVIVSNCVINLSADKDAVFKEAFRVLKPGGRLAVSDVVVRGEVPAAIRRSIESWIGCVAGALEESEFRSKLARAGFESVDIEPTRMYKAEDARSFLAGAGLDADAVAPAIEGKFMSAFIRARKPVR
jgi:ubiquinone/menaquinone biosynthesis C-methylase UbiE